MPFFIFRPFTWLLLRIAYWYLGGICIEGRENVPRKGGILVTPNHISNADPPTIGFALPRASYFMANEKLFHRPVLGLLIRWLHGFPVKPGTPDRAALRRGEELLKQGEALVIFPEGTHSPDGKLLPMQPGALLVAQRAGVPIVPTIVLGTTDLIPYGEEKIRRSGKPVIVRFGAAVTVEELTGGKKGSDGLKAGAARLGELMLALQEGRPYPPAGALPPVERVHSETFTECAL
jgi:1-acyl-sn-glycerol-3-phosphate acyltransferase